MSKLEQGSDAPQFSLKDQHQQTVTLRSLKGRQVLVYFYPKADTPGCTKQSCAVRDALEALSGMGVQAIGISPDTSGAQKKFDDKYELGFPLLADTEHTVAEAYGVWAEKSMYGKTYMGIVRSAFLIDDEGKVAEAWYKVSPDDTVPNVLRALDKH